MVGERWIISLSKNTNAKSIYEKNKKTKIIRLKNLKGKIAKDIKAFLMQN